MRVLGIDPGSRATGYGVVSFSDRRVQYVASGVIRSKDKDFFSRLGEIHSGVEQVISELNPVVIAVEDVFVSRNASSALKLGQARGVVVAAAKSAKRLRNFRVKSAKKLIMSLGIEIWPSQ